ncbi:MAG TPA: hypothetical protein VNI02_08790 [Blastocatellia bacterium]|jgi:hypothetical protein|nr:hypothetical protein [Blastocatellia bacterium]
MRAIRLTLFLLILLPSGICPPGAVPAQEKKALQGGKAPPEGKPDADLDGARFGYRFENARFYIPLIEVDVASNGSGELRFKRGESDEVIDRKLKLLPATVARMRELYERTRFLTSDDDYQDKKDFSHLGWKSLYMRQGGRERKVRFNYTPNLEIRELTEIFLAVATQEMHLFDIETSQQYQPLDLPRLLDALENDLKAQRVAEPEQMLPALKEIAGNDTQPLIARNHATRIADGIKKGKFKSPIRSSGR